MKNSSLISLINSLDKQELKKLEIFLASPFFNQNQNVTTLFVYITSLEKDKRSNLNKQDLHNNVFIGKRYNNENIKTIIYLLTRLCERFLVYDDMNNDEFEFNKRLLSIFDKKGLDTHFIKHLNKSGKHRPGNEFIELNTVSRKVEYEKTLIEFYTKRNFEHKMFKHEQMLSDDLIAAFLVDMFKQYNVFWRTGYLDNVKGEEFTTVMLDSMDLEHLFKIFGGHNFRYNKLLKPYYEIYKILKDDSGIINFEILKESISNNDIISGNEKFIISTILVNTIYYKNLKSSGTFSHELFEAFKLMLQLYHYSGEKYLRFTVFSNILRMGLQLGEYEWTENFINDHYTLLEPSIKENMYYYSNAYLSFAKSEFDICLEYESRMNYDTFQQRYYLRDLRLCSLYELGKYETALSLIDSYKHFIKKDKNYTAKMKQGYILFLTFINDLIRIKLGISRKNIYELREKLSISKLMRKDWLLKKFEEI